MQGTGIWVMGAIMAILGLVGLLLASHAEDGPMYIVGLIFFLFAVLFDFWLVKQSFDRPA
jgi:hypothetical protein